MKLITSLITTAAANRHQRSVEHAAVHAIGDVNTGHARISQCKDGNDQISMIAHLDQTEFPIAPDNNWSDENGEWKRTFSQADLKKAVDNDSNELVLFTTLTTTVDSDEDTDFFKQDQHQLAFKCRFSLDSQIVSTELKITADDTVYDTTAVDANSSGSLGYTLHFDHEQFKLGERVHFSVTPKNTGLVHSRVTHCEVSNGNEKYTIFGTDQYPYCADKFTDFLPPSLPYAGTMNGQSFSFLAFKWHDTSSSVDETQRVACNIEVSATAFATEVVQTCEGEQLVTQPTVITQSPPTNPPDTTADVEITVSTTQSTTTTLPEAECNKQCQKIRDKIAELQAKLEEMLANTN